MQNILGLVVFIRTHKFYDHIYALNFPICLNDSSLTLFNLRVFLEHHGLQSESGQQSSAEILCWVSVLDLGRENIFLCPLWHQQVVKPFSWPGFEIHQVWHQFFEVHEA